jgi:hypothetical protein
MEFGGIILQLEVNKMVLEVCLFFNKLAGASAIVPVS